MIPLPKELSKRLTKRTLPLARRQFNVDVIFFIMSGSPYLSVNKSKDFLVRFCYRMGLKDHKWARLIGHEKSYAHYVMDAAAEYEKNSTTTVT